jgi:5-methyltetrahydropteroyltriglutamate--homocysteine methyltransferase
MAIPMEPIGSVPRPAELLTVMQRHAAGQASQEELRTALDAALRDTIERFEQTGSPIVADGEQSKPSFATYPLAGLSNLAADGVTIPFADGHTRQLPRLRSGPFRYGCYCGAYVHDARRFTALPLKQAVIAPSALSLLYRADGIEGYTREQFLADLIDEAERDVRSCLAEGAVSVQLDFTEGRLAVKLDPDKGLLRELVRINNLLLDRFTAAERECIGIHTCPGGDKDSTHSADIDYAELLPDLFETRAGRFYMQLASEPDKERVLQIVQQHRKPNQSVYVGVIDPIDTQVETPETVRDRVLQAARYIPLDRLGVTDDCGFSPFGDDVSTARDTAFAKMRSRVQGVRLAEKALGIA